MQRLGRQQGLSLLSGLFMLVVVAFVASTLFKIFPHYLDNRALEKIITQVETDPALDIKNLSAFRSHLAKGLQINNIQLEQDAVKAVEDGDKLVVTVNYEKREALIKNIDLVLNFDKEYRVRMP